MNKEEAQQYVQERYKEVNIETLTVTQKVALINKLIQELRQNRFIVIVDNNARYPVQGVSVDDFGMTYLV